MSVVKVTTLQQIFDQGDLPAEFQKFIREDLKLNLIADLVSYVIKDQYEAEWKQIIEGAFPHRAAVAAQPTRAATQTAAAVPAVEQSRPSQSESNGS